MQQVKLKQIQYITVGLARRCGRFLLPPRCVVTGRIVDRPGVIAPEAWQALSFIGAPFCACCGIPFSFGGQAGQLCGPCLNKRKHYDKSRSALRYDDASRAMILRFKHGDGLHAAPCFVPWLRRAGADILGDADVIVPVPLHRWRLWKRRYNQAAVLALALGRAVGVAVLPDALIRIRATPPQGHKGAVDRHRNVRGAFVADSRRSADLKDKHIVLIDDVLTTGATVNECARALKAGGAARVSVLTLARVVREGRDL